MTAGEIAAPFPQVSRAAVSKHLRVVRQASLVQAGDQRRERHDRLDVRPLEQMYRAWLARFALYWEEKLERLKREAEE